MPQENENDTNQENEWGWIQLWQKCLDSAFFKENGTMTEECSTSKDFICKECALNEQFSNQSKHKKDI